MHSSVIDLWVYLQSLIWTNNSLRIIHCLKIYCASECTYVLFIGYSEKLEEFTYTYTCEYAPTQIFRCKHTQTYTHTQAHTQIYLHNACVLYRDIQNTNIWKPTNTNTHINAHKLVWILAIFQIIFSLIENMLPFKIDTEYGSVFVHVICKRIENKWSILCDTQKHSFRKAMHRIIPILYKGASLIVLLVKNPPAMQETLVWFLGWDDSLEKG